MNAVGVTRIVQVSDPHLSAAEGLPPFWAAFAGWIAVEPPAAIVLSGDIVLADPDDAADRRFAKSAFDALGVPVLAIPGNHDVGFYAGVAVDPTVSGVVTADRLTAFTDEWGADRFICDLPGWRLVGCNAYLLGTPDHDRWLRDAIVEAEATSLAVFVHQPPHGDRQDGWQMPPGPAAAFDRSIDHPSVRIVASGHRHSYATTAVGGRLHVWCPSTRFVGNPAGLPAAAAVASVEPGYLEYRFGADGQYEIGQYGLPER